MGVRYIKVTNSKDFEGNELKNARVVDAPVHPNDIANRQFVEENSLNEIVTTRNTDFSVGHIPIGTDINEKTALELWQDALFGIIAPTYTPPVVTMTLLNDGGFPFVDSFFPVGRVLSNYQNTVSVTLNDSTGLDGLNPNVFYSPNSGTPTSATSELFTHKIEQGDNLFFVEVDVLGSDIKNDNTGTPNSTGQFLDATIQSEIRNLRGVWEYYVSVEPSSSESPINTPLQIKALPSTIAPLPNEIIVSIPKNEITTISVAVPSKKDILFSLEGADVSATIGMASILYQQMEGIQPNDIIPIDPIERSWMIFEDETASGDTEVYSIARYRTIKEFPTEMTVKITFKDIANAPIIYGTYFERYYSEEHYSD